METLLTLASYALACFFIAAALYPAAHHLLTRLHRLARKLLRSK